MVLPKSQQCTATVSSKVKLTEHVYLVTFAMQNPPELPFVAGQTMMLHIAEGVNRSMSIASPPSDSRNILMCHDVSPMGAGSHWTLGLSVGDTVSFMAPLGAFVLDKESPRKKVFIATGTGVAPFRSMLLDVFALRSQKNFDPSSISFQSVHQRSPHEKMNPDNPPAGGSLPAQEYVLYWGLRFEEDVYWQEEFTNLSQKYPNFHFVLTLSKPTPTWSGKRGRVTDHVFVEEKNCMETDFYLCGNKAMVAEMREALFARNVPKEQVKTELFF